MIGLRFILYLFLGLTLCACQGKAGNRDAKIAVATNFLETARQLESAFEESSGFDITLVPGSTGKLYAQIKNGAPFAAFLSADKTRPERLIEEGFALPDSHFTYAQGKLALWWPKDEPLDTQTLMAQVKEGAVVAIANPDLAPYGLAATQALSAFFENGFAEAKIVRGENVGQAFAMVSTGNADFGLVALSSVRQVKSGRHWLIPAALYEPIDQDAVLLKRGQQDTAATAFLDYLKTDTARQIIEQNGYNTVP